MRLKEDMSSWRSSGIVKRDFKHGNVPVIERSPTRSHKDTKRWCRGKWGVEHNWHRHQYQRYDWELRSWSRTWVETECQNCHKTMYKRVSNVSHCPMHIQVKKWCEATPIQIHLSDGNYSIIDIDSGFHIGHWD